MKRKLIAGTVAALAVAGGTAGAIAATSNDKKAENAVLADAAKQLGVDATDLKSALSKAEDAQIDAQVKAGTITQAQADEIKQHRQQEGTVLGLGHRGGPGGGPGFGHHGGPGFLLADAAEALGISESKLMSQLRDGKTPAEIAKAAGKSLDDVKAAVKQSATERLDAALKAGDITQAQHDEEIAELDDEIDRLGDFRGFGGPGGFGHHGGPGLADAAKALGVTESKLESYLRAHKTAAEIATATGKTEAQVKAALPMLGDHDGPGRFGRP